MSIYIVGNASYQIAKDYLFVWNRSPLLDRVKLTVPPPKGKLKENICYKMQIAKLLKRTKSFTLIYLTWISAVSNTASSRSDFDTQKF
jgi:hypothetical protein